MKGIFCVIAALMLSGLPAFAGGTREEGSGSAQRGEAKIGTLEVIVQNYYDPTRYPQVAKLMEGFAQAYQDQHPGIGIRLVPWQWPTSESDYRTWLTAKFAAGDEPVIAWEQYYKMWDQKGWWLALDSYLDQPNPYAPADAGRNKWREALPEFVWDSTRAPDGHYYTLAMEWVETGLYYNKDIFAKAGVSPDWKTWREFQDAMDRLKRAGHSPIFIATNAQWSTYQWVDDVLTTAFFSDVVPSMYMDKFSQVSAQTYAGKPWRTLNTEEVAKAIYDGKYSARDPRFTAMLQMLKRWSSNWIAGYSTMDYNGGLSAFLSGKVAMAWLGSWSLPQIAQSAPFDWGVTYIPPIGKDANQYVSADFATVSFRVGGPSAAAQYGITQRAKKEGLEAQAVDFLRYLSTPDRMGKMILALGQFIPMIKGVQSPASLQYFATKIAPLPIRAFTDPVGRWTPEAGQRYNIAIQDYLLGNADLATTVNTIQAIFDEALRKLAQDNNYSWYKR